jgi:hypothetical protein
VVYFKEERKGKKGSSIDDSYAVGGMLFWLILMNTSPCAREHAEAAHLWGRKERK